MSIIQRDRVWTPNLFDDAFFAVEKFFGKADEKDQEDQGKMTDKDGGAILKEILSSYGTQERQAVLNEAMQLSPHLGTGRPAAVQDNVRSFSLWPKIVS
jgi:hypothetical protein